MGYVKAAARIYNMRGPSRFIDFEASSTPGPYTP